MAFKILVPTDFSLTAEKALRYALDIASRCNGVVYLLHVHSPLESPFIETVEIREDYNIGIQQELMAQLHSLRSKWQEEFSNVEIIVALARSPLVHSIISFSQNNAIDLIVMGTQGTSGIRKVIIGTIAVRILGKTTLPLLLIPERFEWRTPGKIIVAVNALSEGHLSLTLVARLAEMYQASTEVIQISEPGEDNTTKNIDLKKYIDRQKLEFPALHLTSACIPAYSAIDTLEKLHEIHPYDLLVMIRHKRTILQRFYLESFTKHMAYLTWHPLLIVPQKD